VLLSLVAIIAAWSGYAAAKFSTESSLDLSGASALHTEASEAAQGSLTYRVGDAITFNAWLGTHTAGDKQAEAVAIKRFRPGFRVAFDAWIATRPFTNPKAPPGPQSMPQYHPPGQAESVRLDADAVQHFKAGEHAASISDDYVRTAVILASVLFLVGISSHFPLRGVRIGLISVGAVLLVFALVHIVTLPRPALS